MTRGFRHVMPEVAGGFDPGNDCILNVRDGLVGRGTIAHAARQVRHSGNKAAPLLDRQWLDKQLAGRQYLMGDKFTIADAYLFTVLRWAQRIELDLGKWPNLKAYVDRVAARPKVQEAMKAEGLLQ